MNPGQKSVAGVSLIELMIALAIGMLLVLGLVQVFAASRTAYQMSEGMSRVQENARFATDYLQHDLRMVGHFGCVNDQSHLQTAGALATHFAPTTFVNNFVVSIMGYEANGTAPGANTTLGSPAAGWDRALPAEIVALNPRPGSDIIAMRYLASEGVPVEAITFPSPTDTVIGVTVARWNTLTSEGVTTPLLYGIADCSRADVFPVPAGFVNPGAGTVRVNAVIDRYTPQPSGQTMLYRAESLVYYIGTSVASGEPALFRARSNGGAYVGEELVEGIENMQLLYGLDRVADLTTAPPSGYIDVQNTAATMGAVADQWRRVGLVQVGLLARSPGIAASTAPVGVNQRRRALGVRFDPPAVNDSRYRASYEVTVAMRNRLYGN